jgi:hypothetical protein
VDGRDLGEPRVFEGKIFNIGDNECCTAMISAKPRRGCPDDAGRSIDANEARRLIQEPADIHPATESDLEHIVSLIEAHLLEQEGIYASVSPIHAKPYEPAGQTPRMRQLACDEA